MAKTKKNVKKPSVVSLRALCEKADITHHKVYSNLAGTYDSLNHLEKTKLASTFLDEVTPFLSKLGFYIKMYRLKDQEPGQ